MTDERMQPEDAVWCARCEMWVPRDREPHRSPVDTGEIGPTAQPIQEPGPLHYAQDSEPG